MSTILVICDDDGVNTTLKWRYIDIIFIREIELLQYFFTRDIVDMNSRIA
jgi:hypothetical protein